MQAGDLAEQQKHPTPVGLMVVRRSSGQDTGSGADERPEAEGGARWSEVRELCPPPTDLWPQCLVSAKLEKLAASWHEQVVHTHEHTVLVALRASARLRVDDDELSMPQGSLAIVPPGMAFSQRAEGPSVDRISVVFRTQKIRAASPAMFTQSTARAREIAAWLVAEQRVSEDEGDAYRNAMLELFVLELNRLQADAGETLQRITHDHIMAHLSEPISLQDLSAAAGMSRYYYCRLYHKLAGEPPMATVRNLRLQRARELALTTDLSLREIAAQVGIGSHCHLSRTLRSHFGVGVRGMRSKHNPERCDRTASR